MAARVALLTQICVHKVARRVTGVSSLDGDTQPVSIRVVDHTTMAVWPTKKLFSTNTPRKVGVAVDTLCVGSATALVLIFFD